MATATLSSIEDFLKKRRKPFTMGDLMSLTGHAAHELEEGLKEAMKKYRCGLEATEEGDLLYDFGDKLVRRTAVSLGERLSRVGATFWRGFSFVYKASLAIVLAAYFILFIVILIAMMVALLAASAKAESDEGASGAIGIGHLIGRLFLSIFEFWTHTALIYQPIDPFGYQYKHFDPRQTHWPRRKKKKKYDTEKEAHTANKSFIASVYDFALGPPRVKLDPLGNEKELATFVRANSGVATTTEVQALAGWPTKKASEFLTGAIVNFDGTAEITENGTFYGKFDNLIRGTEREEERPVVFFWDEYVPEFELTGNTRTRNALIIFMNSFNLLFSYLFMAGVFNEFFPLGATGMFWLAWFPLGFSVSLFVLPILRWGWVRRKQTLQHIENIRRRLMKVLFTESDKEFTLDGLANHANETRTTEETLSAKKLDAIVKDMVVDLEGDSSVTEGATEDATIVFRFDRINNELIDVAEIRQKLLPTTSTGDTVDLLN